MNLDTKCLCGHPMYSHRDEHWEYGKNQANCEECDCKYFTEVEKKKRMSEDNIAIIVSLCIAAIVGIAVFSGTYWIIVAETDKAHDYKLEQDCVKQRDLFLGDNNTQGITEKYFNGIDKECIHVYGDRR
jgi:hypothetical protein